MLSTALALAGLVLAVRLAQAAWRDPTRARLRFAQPRPHRTLPAPLRARLGRALEEAQIGLSPEDAVYVALTAVVAVALIASAFSPALALPGAIATAVAGPIALVLARGRSQRRFVASLPSFVDLVAARLRSGHTVATAMADAAESDDPVAPDVRRVLRRVAMGEPLETALAWWAAERRHDPVRSVAGALAVASATGGAAADALEGVARSMRDQLGARAEAAALSTQARMSAVVVGAAPIAYVVFTAALDPGAAAILVTSPLGRICMVLGLGLDALAALWMRRIVRSEP